MLTEKRYNKTFSNKFRKHPWFCKDIRMLKIGGFMRGVYLLCKKDVKQHAKREPNNIER